MLENNSKIPSRKFIDLIRESGLEKEIRRGIPVTIFLPNSEALSMVPEEEFNTVSREPERLKSLLKYHIIRGEISVRDMTNLLKDRESAKIITVEGTPIIMRQCGKNCIKVNDAKIIGSDMKVLDFNIHVIDRVLVPEKL
ncbi:fasciclin domain-containing protein [Oxyplasma meridianum]|uniref:Fasciclin domain-containing protein n=1 Tax=Oxyplasma meridianum TaxID=3073602 RepID=A0AAX4NJE8_9ARCH